MGGNKSKLLRKDRGAQADGRAASVPCLPAPADDVVTDICQFSEAEFAVGGVDGWVHVYNAEKPSLTAKFRAHRKAVNRFRSWGDRLLTASGDATVRVWRKGAEFEEGGEAQPLLSLQGHEMSVRALDILGGDPSSASSGGSEASPVLITGSRDCTVRFWDLETGAAMQQSKILRNVVTAIRRVPCQPSQAAQASEDLVLRLWDARAGMRPAMEAKSGPNQIICLDVSEDGRYIVGGTKGFSRENCEVKVFDLRSSLRQSGALPCAEQTIEVLHLVDQEHCLIAARDGLIRGLALPELEVVAEHQPGTTGGCTAMGVIRRPGAGPIVLAATAGSEGAELELTAWPDVALRGQPRRLAATG